MKIRSFSIPDEIDRVIRERKTAERMTISEYLRKCVREEVERAAAKRILSFDPFPAR